MSVITWRALQPDLSGINFNSVSNTFNNATDSLNNLLNRGNELNTKNLNEGADMATEKMISMLRQNNTDLNTLNPQQANYKDDAWIRQQVDPRYADRITPGKVTSAFGSLEGELNKKLYDQAAIQGKAEAERTGSIAQGAALTESLMRAGGMQEDRVSSNSTDLVNNQLGVMKAKLSEDTKNFTRDFISNTDFTGLKATDIPHILKSAEQQYGSRIDLDQVRSALVAQMGAVNADKSLELQRQSTNASLANSALALKANQLSYNQALKQSQIPPNPIKTTVSADGTIIYMNTNTNQVTDAKTYQGYESQYQAQVDALSEERGNDWNPFTWRDSVTEKEDKVKKLATDSYNQSQNRVAQVVPNYTANLLPDSPSPSENDGTIQPNIPGQPQPQPVTQPEPTAPTTVATRDKNIFDLLAGDRSRQPVAEAPTQNSTKAPTQNSTKAPTVSALNTDDEGKRLLQATLAMANPQNTDSISTNLHKAGAADLNKIKNLAVDTGNISTNYAEGVLDAGAALAKGANYGYQTVVGQPFVQLGKNIVNGGSKQLKIAQLQSKLINHLITDKQFLQEFARINGGK